MNFQNIKINGMTNPVGFDFKNLNISYVLEAEGDEKCAPRIVVYRKDNGGQILYDQSAGLAKSFCLPINLDLQNETRYYVRLIGGGTESEEYYFETGTDFDCHFITSGSNLSHPLFAKNFSVGKRISHARLYITGVGLYYAELNGKKVGNEYLTPYCNDYDTYLQYQTYDITDLLREENELNVTLGSGWYKGRFGLKHRENIYGDRCAFAAKLVLSYADGSKEILTTDEGWRCGNSQITDSGIYDGESRDDTLAYTADRTVFYDKKFNVIPRVSLPVVKKREIKPTLIVSPKGEKILDFKQNFAGLVSFVSHLDKGQKVTLKAGEILQDGCFFNGNLRTAKAEFNYVSDGVVKEVCPKFTFYGFRYMLLEGFDDVNAGDFTGIVLYSDLSKTVDISTDNPKINRLLENCLWGQRSNFVDVPTDCPQRDERLGWTGDAEVFSATACYQMDCRAFYSKYLKDIEADFNIYGNVTSYSPAVKEGEIACSVWSDAATIIPWNVYNFYGDKQLLSQHFPIMEGYVGKLIESDDKNGGHRLWDYGFHLGDWLSQDGSSPSALKGATDEHFIASVYYYTSVNVVSKAAEVLGCRDKHKYYASIAKAIKNAIKKEYFTPSGRLAIDTQTAYVLCIMNDIYADRKKLVEGFSRRLKLDQYRIKGGFVGATRLIQATVKCGLAEEAFRMLYSEDYPSWLYCVDLGATTIWERWNSVGSDGHLSGTGMNSLNHYSYGAVAESFYSYIAGLRAVTPGFKNAVIEPVFNYRLRNLNFSYDSPSGRYVINYNILSDGNVRMEIVVPYGASATLKLKNRSDRKLSAGKHEITYRPEQELIAPFSADSAVCELLQNERTAAVLKKYVPILFMFLSTQDIGLSGESLRYITSVEAFKVKDEIVSKIDGELRAIRIE